MRPFLVVLGLLISSIAFAWPTDGVRVTGAAGAQYEALVAGDGLGGAYVTWIDARDPDPMQHFDAYLQHVTAEGRVAPGWPTDGLLVRSGAWWQSVWPMIPDGSGGVLVVIGDGSVDEGDLYLQRITAEGQVAPGWPAGGAVVAVAAGAQYGAHLATDGAGGAFVSWVDARTGQGTAYLTHVLGDGTLAPGWPANGRPHEPGPALVTPPDMLADGSGGVFACWGAASDRNASTQWLLGQHYDASGTPLPGWPTGGVLICTEQPRARGCWGLVSDGAGGFYTAWEDYRARTDYTDSDIYAQHVLADGTRAPGWPADGLVVTALPNVTQSYPSLCEDGASGLYVAWMDHRGPVTELYVSRVGADGQRRPGWPADGLAINPEPYYQLDPHIVPDGSGGVYLTWEELVDDYRVRVQHLSGSGAPTPGWPAGGVYVAASRYQYAPDVCTDGAGGAIVGWDDIRGTDHSTNIYAQRFVRDGVVSAQVSLVSAEVMGRAVHLRWQVSGETRATLERRTDAGTWQTRAALEVDGSGYLSYTDTEVVPGTGYGYRLVFTGGAHSGETDVRVPASLTLALAGARPNPASGWPTLSFTLPDGSPATLALHDISGRRVAMREVGTLGAGAHVLRLGEGALAPGLYWASLTRGGQTLRARVVVTR